MSDSKILATLSPLHRCKYLVRNHPIEFLINVVGLGAALYIIIEAISITVR